jgi:hypothetical protein
MLLIGGGGILFLAQPGVSFGLSLVQLLFGLLVGLAALFLSMTRQLTRFQAIQRQAKAAGAGPEAARAIAGQIQSTLRRISIGLGVVVVLLFVLLIFSTVARPFAHTPRFAGIIALAALLLPLCTLLYALFGKEPAATGPVE